MKLAYGGAFQLKEVWRDAADFETFGNPNGIPSFSPATRKELPWVTVPRIIVNPNGVAPIPFPRVTSAVGHNPGGVAIFLPMTPQGSSFLAILGWWPQSLWDGPNSDTPAKNREVAMQRLEDQGEKILDRSAAVGGFGGASRSTLEIPDTLRLVFDTVALRRSSYVWTAKSMSRAGMVWKSAWPAKPCRTVAGNGGHSHQDDGRQSHGGISHCVGSAGFRAGVWIPFGMQSTKP